MDWFEDWDLAGLMVERTFWWTCPRCDLRQGNDRRQRVYVCRGCGTEVHKMSNLLTGRKRRSDESR